MTSNHYIAIKPMRGVVLYGPPGTGKTSMIRDICNHMKVEPRIVNGPELLNKYVGNSEQAVRQLFIKAKNDQKKSGESNTRNTVVSQMLTKMDGYEQLNNIVIFGTTNRLDMIDPALLRDGRFELKFKIDLPNVQERFEILKFFTKPLQENKRLASNVTNVVLSQIAQGTTNYSGADLEQLIQCAIDLAIRRVVKVSLE
ncbi:unnamed protein product [Rotaria sordida]|uniref:Vesicle-fusing ATPase n=1 Tax=Rotaria sordida TaxID=392033 RepID=A0A818LPI7_9BILA|nr:unnamed protein product [Rotaria sordida]